jgi:hypothetical protein
MDVPMTFLAKTMTKFKALVLETKIETSKAVHEVTTTDWRTYKGVTNNS